MKEKILNKIFSRNFMLPLVAMGLLFISGLKIKDVDILTKVMVGLCILATGYNGFGSLSTFIKGKNGKGNNVEK